MLLSLILSAIEWNPKSDIFTIPGIGWPVKWYSLMWLLGFVLSQQILFYVFKKEGKPREDIEVLTIYMFVGTLIGARFGHYLFYQPEVLFSDPLEVILPPYAGLASHGAAIGILTALYFFCRKKNYNYFWMVDRLVIVVAIAGCCIRLGNLINSEIIGTPTDVPWAFIFVQDRDHPEPRHPAQLYEAIFCFFLFFALFYLWKKKRTTLYNGVIFGIFLVALFGQRFIVEHYKENQVPFEDYLPINMGQILSIPFVLIGIVVLIISYRVKSREVRMLAMGNGQ